MLPIDLILLSTTLLTSTFAQSILPSAASSTFPACGLQCTTLIQAADSCLPPAAPVASQAIYNSCFCQSALLTTLKTTPGGPCTAFCTAASDQQLLENWYNGYCAAGGASGAAGNTLSTLTQGVTTETIIVSPTSSGDTASTLTATGGQSASTDSGSSEGSTGVSTTGGSTWISNHWRWILMLAILLIAFVLIALLAVCLKRRHNRKVEAKRAALSGFPSNGPGRTPTPVAQLGQDMWGPHQHMAHTRGWQYPSHEQQNKAGEAAVAGALASERRKDSRRKVKRRDSDRAKSYSRANVRELNGEADAYAAARPGFVDPEKERSQSMRTRDRDRERSESRRKRPQTAPNRTEIDVDTIEKI